jgi:hypothetical protein
VERELAVGISILVAGKVVANALRRDYGFTIRSALASARTPTQVDAAYLIALTVCLAVVWRTGVEAGLSFAILLQAGIIVGSRFVLPGNHDYLDLFAAVLCLRLMRQPDALFAALQTVTVSVWVYAAFQKLYHGEFVDGSFFYVALQENARYKHPQWWAKPLALRAIPPIDGYFAQVNSAGQAFCRRLAILVVVAELLVPLVALMVNGTVWSFLLMLALAMPIVALTGESNFFITNAALGLAFLAPFRKAAWPAIASDPIALAIVAWCLLWPPAHAALVRRYRFTPWKLAGWGMFATAPPRVYVVDSRGVLIPAPAMASTQLSILTMCGYCRIRWLREYACRSFFRLYRKEKVKGVLFRWYRRRGERYVTECVWLCNAHDASPRTFEVADERAASDLNAFVLGPADEFAALPS